MTRPLFWLSFSKDGKNAGVAIVEGDDMIEAIRRAWELDINPGGQVAGFPMDEGSEEVEKLGIDRLISREELVAAGYAPKKSIEELLDAEG